MRSARAARLQRDEDGFNGRFGWGPPKEMLPRREDGLLTRVGMTCESTSQPDDPLESLAPDRLMRGKTGNNRHRAGGTCGCED
jgi:hypothetical protein